MSETKAEPVKVEVKANGKNDDKNKNELVSFSLLQIATSIFYLTN